MKGSAAGTALAVLMSAAAWAGPAGAGDVEVRHAWARATVEGMRATGVFLVIDNESGRDVRLVGGASGAAEAVEVHTMETGGEGEMRMRPLEGGLPVPAGAVAELKPRAEHLMLIGLREPLAPGGTVPLVLEFADGATIAVRAEVRGRGRGGRHRRGERHDDHHDGRRSEHHDDHHDGRHDEHHDDHHDGRGGHHDH